MTSSPTTTPVVLYVVGKGRSGSTLLDTLLGQVPGVASTGELRFLWEWGVEGGFRCGCGQTVATCPRWTAVLEGVARELPWTADVTAVRRVVDGALRWPRVPGTVLAARRGRTPDRLRDFVELHRVLYQQVARTSGARVIVDSSKWPAHPGLLGMVDGIRPVVIHLVRDPRGVANSYRVGKDTGGDQPVMPRFGVVHSSLSWAARNAVAELLPSLAGTRRVVRLRYEDFVQQPAESLRMLVEAAGLEGAELGFVDGHAVTVGPTHTVGGNPGRFRTGVLSLTPDERWHEQLPTTERILVELLTVPLRRRYGYEQGRP